MPSGIAFCRVCGKGPIPVNRFVCERLDCIEEWKQKGYDLYRQAEKEMGL